jgi:hypothetical protein
MKATQISKCKYKTTMIEGGGKGCVYTRFEPGDGFNGGLAEEKSETSVSRKVLGRTKNSRGSRKGKSGGSQAKAFTKDYCGQGK